jgi:hypothetical protein
MRGKDFIIIPITVVGIIVFLGMIVPVFVKGSLIVWSWALS